MRNCVAPPVAGWSRRCPRRERGEGCSRKREGRVNGSTSVSSGVSATIRGNLRTLGLTKEAHEGYRSGSQYGRGPAGDDMSRKMAVTIGAVAIGIAATIALFRTFGTSNSASAQDLLAKAATADVSPQPGTILHLKTRVLSRTKPSALRLQDPYHLDRYQTTPEVSIGDAWFEADASGKIVRRYTAVTDENGVLIQEESRVSSAEELVYNVADNVVERIPSDAGSQGGALQTIDVSTSRPGAQIRSAGSTQIAGIDAKRVTIDTPPVILPPREVAYERPYVRDLTPTLVRETFNINPTNGAILGYSVDLMEGNTPTRVSERTVLTLESVAPADLPSGFFELKHATGIPELQDSSNAPKPPTFVADSLDDSRLAGKRVVTLPEAQKYGLLFAGVHGAEAPVPPPPGGRDIRVADEYGLALTAEYQGAKGADGGIPTLRITVGARADLLPLLQSALPFWSSSSPVAVSAFGKTSDAWLMQGVGDTAVILERDGAIVMWDAQGIDASTLLQIVASSLEVEG